MWSEVYVKILNVFEFHNNNTCLCNLHCVSFKLFNIRTDYNNRLMLHQFFLWLSPFFIEMTRKWKHFNISLQLKHCIIQINNLKDVFSLWYLLLLYKLYIKSIYIYKMISFMIMIEQMIITLSEIITHPYKNEKGVSLW